MNIAGPIKISESIIRAFDEGCQKLEYRTPKELILYKKIRKENTGCEAYYVIDEDSVQIKKICTEIEEESALGRLFDMDVLNKNGEKLDRTLVSGKSRDCIVCGAEGRGCASRRLHSVQELQLATENIIKTYFEQKDREEIASFAVQSLLEEVCITPKPGLVDCNNSGSHNDMNLFTFMASAASLHSYFSRCIELGQHAFDLNVPEFFHLLQQEGLTAEQKMFRATRGVNTHKGAIYILGILCGAIGRCWKTEKTIDDMEEIMIISKKLAEHANKIHLEGMKHNVSGRTAGEQLYLKYGITGVREEIANGLPSVRNIGMPVFKEAIERGYSFNRAGCAVLLHLIQSVSDTNLYHRGGCEGVEYAVQRVTELLQRSKFPEYEEIAELDKEFMKRNLSPGGCADLLAVTIFLYKIENNKE